MKKTILPFFIPFQGCPYTCTYCDQNVITGTPVQSVGADISAFFRQHREYDAVEVGFFGGTFTCIPVAEQTKYLSEVAPFIREHKISRIRCSTRPDAFVDFDRNMYRSYGCTHFEMGVQSFSDRWLHFLGRSYSAQTVADTCAMLKENGFSYGLQLMCGFPGQTESEFLSDIERLIELQPEDCRIYPLAVLKNTSLADLYEKERWDFPTLPEMVDRVARAAFRIEAVGITILRMGLAHSEELADTVVAGTYHPSFADLVRRRQLEMSIATIGTTHSHIIVHPKDYEYVRSMLKEYCRTVSTDASLQRGCIKSATIISNALQNY